MSRNGKPYLLEKTPVETGDGSKLGSVILYKRSDHNEPRMWNCRIKVSAERRYLTRACKTRDETEARNTALEYYWEAKTLKKHGDTVRLWSKSFDKLVDEWLKDVKELAEIGITSKSQQHRYYYGIRGWKEYLGNKAVSSISQDDVDNYERWRQETSSRGKPYARTTINHEHMGLSVCLKWAVKKKYIKLEDMPDVALGLKKRERGKKPGFTDKEWTHLVAFMRGWAKDPKQKSHTLRSRIQFWRYCMVLANSGMRVGEARYLKWKHYVEDTEDGVTYIEFLVNGKTGERRLQALDNCYVYINLLKQDRDTWLDPDDYIFVNKDGSYIRHQGGLWRSMLEEAGLLYAANGKTRSITSLRHFYATRQLVNNDVDVFRLAENMGTSVEQIKNHYADINPRLFRKHLTGKDRRTKSVKKTEKTFLSDIMSN